MLQAVNEDIPSDGFFLIHELRVPRRKEFEVRVLDESEYREALRRKVVEEATEIMTAPEAELSKEIGDLYEVLEALIAACDLDSDEIRAMKARRRAERGGFDKQLELLWVE